MLDATTVFVLKRQNFINFFIIIFFFFYVFAFEYFDMTELTDPEFMKLIEILII